MNTYKNEIINELITRAKEQNLIVNNVYLLSDKILKCDIKSISDFFESCTVFVYSDRFAIDWQYNNLTNILRKG
jgi:hypothetical protein